MSGHADRSFSLYQVRFAWENADFHSSCRATEERFVWEMPIYKPHVESRRSVLRGKFLFTNLRSSHGGAFCVGNAYLQTQLAAWRSASCGKFLFTNSTGAFRVGNFYLQTQLVCFPCLRTIYKKPHSSGKKAFSRRAIRGQKSFNQTLDFYMPVLEIAFFP